MLFKTLGCLFMLGIAVILAFVIGLRILIGKILGLGSKQKTTYRHENPQPEQAQKKPSNGRPADGKKIFSAQEGEYIDYEEIK